MLATNQWHSQVSTIPILTSKLDIMLVRLLDSQKIVFVVVYKLNSPFLGFLFGT